MNNIEKTEEKKQPSKLTPAQSSLHMGGGRGGRGV